MFSLINKETDIKKQFKTDFKNKIEHETITIADVSDCDAFFNRITIKRIAAVA